ncbi:MAG: heavy metal translocating P-type ATPase, partial [Bacteroidia bacterium]
MKTSSYKTDKLNACYHCGESCGSGAVHLDQKNFCCDGCRLVYELLKESSLCTYYNLNNAPGATISRSLYAGKYDYLDKEEVRNKMISFSDGETDHITFYLPAVHCSSCIWLLENMQRLDPGIISATVNFPRKEVSIVFNKKGIRLSGLAELLSRIGYEPLISLESLEDKKTMPGIKNRVLKIGLAGFCFGNIMMLSFPEYFALGNFQDQKSLSIFFSYLNLALALPVFFYCASGFFVSAWKSLRYRYLNIDAPIALAILVTFTRSVYEILSHTGAGYMDSMSGIVFFMLIGRYFQDRSYETLSFERDYKAYFPIGVTVKANGKESSLPVSELKKGDHIIIRNAELIPADAILLNTAVHVDYSFITGESAPVKKFPGELIYAGARQIDGAAELEVAKPVSQSYLTKLWNKDTQWTREKKEQGFIAAINTWFTAIVLSTALSVCAFWLYADSSKALNALTAVLIVACPCGLLLTSTFVNGNILGILGKNKFYLKNASVINRLAEVDTLLFDKTGTITHGSVSEFTGPKLSEHELRLLTSLAAQSA